ncbi:hypothetical protein [Clostridium botulinum]|uniref:hypothetical protein n=1 Tax=Clostridium botulinum TaxID=1491 RepID=UPI00196A07AF|nr:hypothetical protein [Clostridium botulinum]MBN3386848.1 hypothetical protein [Clostridium botulinum]
MTLKETIEKFLNEKVSKNSYEIYKGKIYVFYKFLLVNKGINDSSYSSYLEGMKIKEIQESLNFYIIDNSIKAESAAWHYIAVIKRYFKFLYDLGIKNTELIKSFSISETNKDSFQYKIYKQINQNKRLIKKGNKQEITFDEAKIIISECDEQIEEILDGRRILEYNKHAIQYNDFVGCIIIKLILLTGTTYRNIRLINFSDLNNVHNTLSINDYVIHIPDKLSEQLNFYIDIRKNIIDSNNKQCSKLFINIDGAEINKQNGLIHNKLKEIIGRGDITGALKFVIMQMIKKGINQNIIQSFTGIGDNIYNYCQNKINESKNMSSSRYLDSKIRSLEIYDLM